jgi:chromate transporter
MNIYLLLFLEFFKIGLFTFGGGYAMIPLVKEVVLEYGWLTESEFYNFIGICESTPGPIAINMATYIGARQGDLLGSICATVGVILPSFIIIILIAALLKNIIKNSYVQAFLTGIKPVVLGLISSTGLVLLAKAIGYVDLKTFNFNLVAVIIFSILVILYFGILKLFKKKLSAISVILISAILGILISIIVI